MKNTILCGAVFGAFYASSLAPLAAAPFVRLEPVEDILPLSLDSSEQVLTFSPDGKTLLLSDETYQTTAWIYNLASGARTKLGGEKQDRTNAWAYSPDSKWVAAISPTYGPKNSAAVVVWRLSDGALQAKWNEVSSLDNASLRWTNVGLAVTQTGSPRKDADWNELQKKFAHLPQRETTFFLLDTSSLENGRIAPIRRVLLKHNFEEVKTFIASPDASQLAAADGKNVYLFDAQSGEIKTTWPLGISSHNMLLRFSPDGQKLLLRSGWGNNLEVLVLDVRSGEKVNLEKSVRMVYGDGDVQWSPDSKLVVSDGLSLWNAQTGTFLGGVQLASGYHTSWTNPIAFLPDNKLVTVFNGVVVWDIEKLRALNGRVLESPSPAPQIVETKRDAAAWEKNYGYYVKRSSYQVNKSSVKRWEVRDDRNNKVVGWLPEAIYYGDETRAPVAIAPGGKILAVANYTALGNTEILLHDVVRNRAIKPLRVVKDSVESLRFSPDGKRLAIHSANRRLRIFDIHSGELQSLWNVNPFVDKDENNYAASGAMAWSPDGTRLAVPGPRGVAVEIRDARSGRILRVLKTNHQESISGLAWSPDGQAIAIAGAPLAVWDLKSGQMRRQFRPAFGQNNGKVSGAGFSPDGRSLYVQALHSGTYEWPLDWMKQQPPAPLQIFSHESHASAGSLQSWNWDNGGLQFSPDGNRLASAGKGGAIVWNLAQGKRERVVKVADALWFSPDGRAVLFLDNRKKTHSIDLSRGLQKTLTPAKESSFTLSVPRDQVKQVKLRRSSALVYDKGKKRSLFDWLDNAQWMNTASFSPDGTLWAAGTENQLWLWELSTRKARRLQAPGQVNFMTIEISPDNRYVAATSSSGWSYVWNAQSGQLLHYLAGHLAVVTGATFSPDEKFLATASEDGTLRVWNVQSGQLRSSWEAHAGAAVDVAFSPNGQKIASRGQDGTIKIWRAPALQTASKVAP